MNHLKIEYIPLDELTPYEKNARLHTEVDLALSVNLGCVTLSVFGVTRMSLLKGMVECLL